MHTYMVDFLHTVTFKKAILIEIIQEHNMLLKNVQIEEDAEIRLSRCRKMVSKVRTVMSVKY